MFEKHFIQMQQDALKKLEETGELPYVARRQLMNIRRHNNLISREFEDLFNILLDVYIADTYRDIWMVHTKTPYNYMSSHIFDLAKHYIGIERTEVKKYEVMRISDHMKEFKNDVFSHEFSDYYPTFFFAKINTPSEQEKKKAFKALCCIVSAISTIAGGGKYFEDNPVDDMPDEDDPYICAVDAASKATDLSPKEFWTWYIDVAFPRALAEVPKYLKQEDSM